MWYIKGVKPKEYNTILIDFISFRYIESKLQYCPGFCLTIVTLSFTRLIFGLTATNSKLRQLRK